MIFWRSASGSWNHEGPVQQELDWSHGRNAAVVQESGAISSSTEEEKHLGFSLPSPSNLLPMPPIGQTHQNPADMGTWDGGPMGSGPLHCNTERGRGKARNGCEDKQAREQHTTPEAHQSHMEVPVSQRKLVLLFKRGKEFWTVFANCLI